MADSVDKQFDNLLQQSKNISNDLFEKLGITDDTELLPLDISNEDKEDTSTSNTLDSFFERIGLTDDVELLPAPQEQEMGGIGDLFSGVFSGAGRQLNNYLQTFDIDNEDIELPNQSTYLGSLGDSIGSNATRLGTQLVATAAGALGGGAASLGVGAPAGAIAGWTSVGALNTASVARETYKSLYNQALANGATEEGARRAAWEGTVQSVGFEAAANFIPVGKIGGLVRGASTAAKVGRVAGMVGVEGTTEAIQQKIENEAVNRNLPYGRSINTNEGVLEAGLTGTLAAGITKGSFEVAGGTIKGVGSKLRSKIEESIRGKSEEAKPTQSPKTDEQELSEATQELSKAAGVVEETQPTEEAKPAEQVQTTEEAKPAEQVQTTVEAAPAEQVQTTEEVKPAEQVQTTTVENNNPRLLKIVGATSKKVYLDNSSGETTAESFASLEEQFAQNPKAKYKVTYINDKGKKVTVSKTGDKLSAFKSLLPSNQTHDIKDTKGTEEDSVNTVGNSLSEEQRSLELPITKGVFKGGVLYPKTLIHTATVPKWDGVPNVEVQEKLNSFDYIIRYPDATVRFFIKDKEGNIKHIETSGERLLASLGYKEETKSTKEKKPSFNLDTETEEEADGTKREVATVGSQVGDTNVFVHKKENQADVKSTLEVNDSKQETNQAATEANSVEQPTPERAEKEEEVNKDLATARKEIITERKKATKSKKKKTPKAEDTTTEQPESVEGAATEQPESVEETATTEKEEEQLNRIAESVGGTNPDNNTLNATLAGEKTVNGQNIDYATRNPERPVITDTKTAVVQMTEAAKDTVSRNARSSNKRKWTTKVNKALKSLEALAESNPNNKEIKKAITDLNKFKEALKQKNYSDETFDSKGVEESLSKVDTIINKLESKVTEEKPKTSKKKVEKTEGPKELTTNEKYEKFINEEPDKSLRRLKAKLIKNIDEIMFYTDQWSSQIDNDQLKTIAKNINDLKDIIISGKVSIKSKEDINKLNNVLAGLSKQVLNLLPTKTNTTSRNLYDDDDDLRGYKGNRYKDDEDDFRYKQKSLPNWDNPKQTISRGLSQIAALTSKKGRVGKEQVWETMLNIAQKLGVTIHTDLDTKGIAGKVAKGEEGVSDIVHRIANIVNSRNVEAANHELGHFIFNDGGFATGEMLGQEEFFLEMQALGNGVLLSSKQTTHIEDKYGQELLPEEIFANMISKYFKGSGWDNVLEQTAPKTMAALKQFFETKGMSELVEQARTTSEEYYAQGAWKQAVADFIDDPSGWDNFKMWINENLSSAELRSRLYVKIFDDMSALRHVAKELKDEQDIEKAKTLINKIEYYSQSTLNESVLYSFYRKDGRQAGGCSIVKFKNLIQILQQVKNLAPKNEEEILKKFGAYLVAKQTVSEYAGNEEAINRLEGLADRLGTTIDDVLHQLNLMYKEFEAEMRWDINGYVDIERFKKGKYSRLKSRYDNLPARKDLLDRVNAYRKAIYEEFTPTMFRNSPYYSKVTEAGMSEEAAYMDTMKELFTFKADSEIRNTGMDLEGALEIINEVEQDDNADVYQNAAAEFYTFQDQFLDYIAGQSAEMKYTVDEIRKANSSYHVPLLRYFTPKEAKQRLLDETSGREYEMDERVGSDRSWKNLVPSILYSMQTMIQNAHKSASYEALSILNNFEGTGPYIREITMPKTVVEGTTKDVTIALRKAVKLAGKGVTYNYDKIAEQLINNVGGTVSLYVFNEHLAANQFRIFDPEANEGQGKFRYFETDIAIADSIRRPDFIETAAEFNKAARMYKHYSNIVRSLMTTYNPAFVFWNNLGRDTLSMAVKGAKTGNPLVDYLLPVRILFAAKYQLQTVLGDWLFHRGEPFAVLDTLGLHANQQQINNELQYQLKYNAEKGKVVHSGEGSAWGWVKAHIKDFGEWMEMSDKNAQMAQLKWMLNKDKVHIDDIDLTKEHLINLYANKETLRRHGITLDTVRDILTAEQVKTWELTTGDTKLNLDLSGDQLKQIEDAIDWSKTKLLSQDQLIKYSKQVRNAIINFSQGGKFTRFMNHFFIFSKARTNGLIQNLTWIKKNPILAAIYAAEMWGMGMLHGLLFPDDMDDDDPDDMLQGITVDIGGRKTKFRMDAMYMAPYALGYLIGKGDDELSRMTAKIAWQGIKNDTVGAYGSPNPVFNIGMSLVTGKDFSRWLDKGVQPVVPEYLQTKYYGHPEKQINNMVGPLAALTSKLLTPITGMSPITINYYYNQMLGGAPARIEELMGYSSYLAHANNGWTPDGMFTKTLSRMTGKRYENINSRYIKGISEVAKEALGDYNTDRNNKTLEARKCVATAADLVMQSYKQLYWAQKTEEGRNEVLKVMSSEAKRLYLMLTQSPYVYKSASTVLNRKAKYISKRADILEKY